ncbi:DUF5666 domain-containing protein [Arthrobacter sp. OV608]|uniref:DUF5666 domain-containing protein n=1 Tax=Arthrobacter sp. OV608 TaxID=1882768 RepID=UPI0008BE3253|nr:DUF5666 domain-containing protein [Arthrobacter sp. OV608]SEQ17361.1 hypothetical protein SAMN05444745_104197 [Arthrobacter sp. OV608]
MSVRGPFKYRKAVLAGVVALGLTGTGAAFVWAASDPAPPSPSQSQSERGKSDDAPGQKKPDKPQRPQHLHSEGVVKKADGTFQTILEQRGTVEAVSDTSITVKSEDGYSQEYTVNADTKVTKAPAAEPDNSQGTDDGGKRLKRTEGTIADIATGDTVRISGVKDGDQATAERIAEGAGDGPGFGMGRGHGHAKGHSK